MIISIDRSTCQTEEECVWQCGTHLLAKVTFLCAVCLVHQKDDIAPFIKYLAINQISKLEDCGDKNLALVNLCFQFRFTLNSLYIRNLCTSEIACYLVFQINTVIHNEHCWRLQILQQTKFLSSEDHQPRFTRTLKMPNQSLLRSLAISVSVQDTLHNSLSTQILLIPTHYLYLLTA